MRLWPLVLLYHSLSERPCSGLEIDPEMLRRQLVSVLDRGLTAVTVSEAFEERNGCFAVTFDDAALSIREQALPVLSELGIPATAFVQTPLDGTWGSLTRDDLGALVEAGWEIGSHCVTHRRLTGLSRAELWAELADSRVVLERELGRPCTSVAYPFGAANERVVGAARAAGYGVGFTVFGVSRLQPARLCWPRVGVNGLEPMLAFRFRSWAPVRAFRVAAGR